MMKWVPRGWAATAAEAKPYLAPFAIPGESSRGDRLCLA